MKSILTSWSVQIQSSWHFNTHTAQITDVQQSLEYFVLFWSLYLIEVEDDTVEYQTAVKLLLHY